MPLSPLTRLLLVLTLLAFVPVFVWLEDDGKVAQTMLGIALSLLVAAVFRLIRDNPPLGDGAFHRTRPSGDSRAFRRNTFVLVALTGGVSLMAAARSGYHHLGEAVVVRSAAIVLGYLGLVVAALAVGIALASDKSSSPRRIAVVLIALPVAVFLLIHESRSLGSWLGVNAPRQDWTMRISGAVPVGLAGFATAWWLAARKGSSRRALWISGIVAAALPVLHGTGDLWPMPVSPLPAAAATFSRGPRVGHELPAGSIGRLRNPSWSRMDDPLYLPFEGRITASGLRDDEFVSLRQLDPQVRVAQGYRSSSGSGWGGGYGVLADGGDFQAHFRHLAEAIPGRPALVLSRNHETIGNWVSVERSKAALDALETNAWTLDETVFRFTRTAGFPVTRGGFGAIPSGGSVRVFPAQVNAARIVLRFRLVLPGEYGDEWGEENANTVRALLVDESTGRAWMPTTHLGYRQISRAWSLASYSQDWRVEPHLPDLPGLTTEVALRCTLHIFTSQPVAEVKVTLPPGPGGQD